MILLGSMVFSSFAACGNVSDTAAQSYEAAYEGRSYVPTGQVAENGRFSLHWDAEKLCILLNDKTTGKIWSSTPYDSYQNNETVDADIRSLMFLDFITVGSRTNSITAGSSCQDVTSKKVDNGIQLAFWFDKLKISVPLRFLLTGEGLRIEMPVQDIVEEKHSHKVFKVAFAPFFCSVENSVENYLFVPSGCGALLYADERGNGSERSYSGALYGHDPLHTTARKYTEEEPMRMGVFGSVSNGEALCAVIENGNEYAWISADAGNSAKGISNVYVWFQVRGINSTTLSTRRVVNYYTDSLIDEDVVSVAYYPLYDQDAGYTGFAKKYREYLKEKYGLEKSSDDALLSLKILGGAKLKKFFLGIPYEEVEALTTFEETRQIINEMQEIVDGKITVLLQGFGKSGLDIGKIAGGYRFSSALGTDEDFQELSGYCAETGVPLFVDYDVVRFSKGLFSTFKAAENVNHLTGEQMRYSIITGMAERERSNLLLKRSDLSAIVDKLSKRARSASVSGISLGSLSNLAYSDFRERQYYVKGGMDDAVYDEFQKLKRNQFAVASISANDYAAVASDFVFETVCYSTQNLYFDVEVPFYQIVFKGYVPMSSGSINTSADPQRQLLRALETGIGLQFTLVNDYHTDFAPLIDKEASQSVYRDNKDDITQTVIDTSAYLNSVKNVAISSHSLLTYDVHKTVFENGVTIYVNYGAKEAAADGVTVAAMDYVVVK